MTQKAGWFLLAKACPTQSIQSAILKNSSSRQESACKSSKTAISHARIYDPQENQRSGIHAFFVILGEPEAYNLPAAPQVPTIHLKSA